MATEIVPIARPSTAMRLHTATNYEAAIRFALWAAQRNRVEVPDIVAFLRCSRATGYRWLRALKDARGEA